MRTTDPRILRLIGGAVQGLTVEVKGAEREPSVAERHCALLMALARTAFEMGTTDETLLRQVLAEYRAVTSAQLKAGKSHKEISA